jgi:hypothetical protein
LIDDLLKPSPKSKSGVALAVTLDKVINHNSSKPALTSFAQSDVDKKLSFISLSVPVKTKNSTEKSPVIKKSPTKDTSSSFKNSPFRGTFGGMFGKREEKSPVFRGGAFGGVYAKEEIVKAKSEVKEVKIEDKKVMEVLEKEIKAEPKEIKDDEKELKAVPKETKTSPREIKPEPKEIKSIKIKQKRPIHET